MNKSQHPRIRELKFTLSRIFKNPSAIIGFTLLLFFVGVAVLAPVLAPPKYAHNPYQMPHKGFSPTPKAPSEKAIFGTTSGQYDIYYGVVWGTRTAFKIGLFVVTPFVLLFGSVLAHEYGHIFAARYYGLQVGQTILTPIGGMVLVKTITLGSSGGNSSGEK